MVQNAGSHSANFPQPRKDLWQNTKTLGSLSTHVFEMRTAAGREHFVYQDSGVSQIFILIIANGEKILSNVNVVVRKQVKRGKKLTSGCRRRLKNARA